jgi:hypothetical protein
MRIRRAFIAIPVVFAVVTAACGGGGGSSTQPQTEEGAVAAAERALRGTYTADIDDVMAFMSAECREKVDRDEIRDALILVQAFMSSDELNLSDLEVRGTATSFDGDQATISVELIPPEGVDLDGFGLSDEEIDVIYENGKWVSEDCDFEDTSGRSLEDLEAELETLGLAGTKDDPVPANLATPVGEGFVVAITGYEADAAATITERGGSEPFLDEGEIIAMVSLDVGYGGTEEPTNLSQLQLQLVGSDGVAIDQAGCGNMTETLYFSNREAFSGASLSVVSCFSATPDRFPDEPELSVEVGFGNRPVFFAPTTEAATPTTVTGSTGPAADGDATDDRTAPAALGSAVDVGEGWTVTVNSADLDADAAVAAASDFNNPPPPGTSYVLIDVTLAYDGSETSSSGFSVDTGAVGDSNVSATDCFVSGLDNEIDRFADVFPGGALTGTLCFVVDEADTDSLLFYANGNAFEGDPDFFAVR